MFALKRNVGAIEVAGSTIFLYQPDTKAVIGA